MRKYLLLSLLLSGCATDGINETVKTKIVEYVIPQNKVTAEKGVFYGTLVGKRPIGRKFICYYDYSGVNPGGTSLIKETCPKVITVIRK